MPTWLNFDALTNTISGNSSTNEIGISTLSIVGTSVYGATAQT